MSLIFFDMFFIIIILFGIVCSLTILPKRGKLIFFCSLPNFETFNGYCPFIKHADTETFLLKNDYSLWASIVWILSERFTPTTCSFHEDSNVKQLSLFSEKNTQCTIKTSKFGELLLKNFDRQLRYKWHRGFFTVMAYARKNCDWFD